MTPNPAINRTCAKSRAVRLFLRWASRMRAILPFIFLTMATPLSLLAQDNARTSAPLFKGVELYSWRDSVSGKWAYSLLPGTNRHKKLAEIKDANRAIPDVAQLKQRLANLAEGEQVFWLSGRFPTELAHPDKNVLDDVVQFAAGMKIKVFIIK